MVYNSFVKAVLFMYYYGFWSDSNADSYPAQVVNYSRKT